MKKIAIQGVEGSYHDMAAHQYFEHEPIELICCTTFEDVFTAMSQDNNVIGLLAIGGAAVGLFAMGGGAFGVYAAGGGAIASEIAIGGSAHAPLAIGRVAEGALTFVPGSDPAQVAEAIRQAASGAPRFLQNLLIFLAQNW